MAYRGYDEPDYIDDDEYFDPDAGRRGSSNVLGGSGSRRDAGAAGADAWQDQPAPNRREPERARPKRSVNTRKPSQQPRQGQSNAARPRERGGKPDARRDKAATAKPGNSQSPERADEAGRAKRRFGKLPSPFRFNNRNKNRNDNRNNEKKPGRLKALAGRFGRLRPGGARSKPEAGASPAQSSRRAGGKTSKPSVRAAFGASRGESRGARRESKPGGMPRARLDRADSENPTSKAPIFKSGDWLDLDRKLDLIGVGLVFAAIVLFFSALSREQAAIGAVHRLIGQLLGWGALAAPLTMFAVGIWLILRHFGDQAPLIDPVRLSGAISAFIGVLVLFQFGEALGYASDSYCAAACIRGLVESSYLAGRGGGLIGGWIYQVLVINLTELGGFVVVAMVLTFATMMITRMSMAELTTVALGIARSAQAAMAQQAAKGRARQLRIEEQALLARHKPQVRVSKPEAAKLSGSVAGAKALPEPTGYAMPIPARLRDMLSKRVSILRADSSSQAAAQALAHAETAPGSAAPTPERHRTPFFGRFFGGAGEPTAPERAKPGAANAAQVRKTRHEPNWRASAGKPAPPAKIARGGLARQATERKNRPSAEQRSAENPETTWQRSSTRPQPDLPSQGLPQDEASLAAHSARPDDRDWHLKSPQPGASSAPFYDIEDDANDVGSPGNGAARRADAAERYEETRPPDSASAHDIAPAAVPSTVQAAHVTQSNSPAEPASKQRPRVDWQMPDFSAMLAVGSTGEVNEDDLLQQAQIIEDTLASCNAPGRVVAYNSGPVITQFCVVPDVLETRAGKTRLIKVSAIARTDKDLQRTLSAKSIRIQAPVPGQDYVGIEVPNPAPAIVSLRDVMESDSFQAIDSPLAIALGMSVNGAPMSADLAQMPHLLIAGATGAGKSICLNAIISSILAYRRPDEVKFIMIDPKLVELTGYNGLPHLVDSVVGDPEKTVSVLRWVIHEMDERYEKFKKVRAKNLSQYNNILAEDSPPLPYIVVIIDELAELMLVAKSAEAEQAIVRLAAKARASGIHLIIATQRPSVDVVTGSIKANFPARIAFRVSDSRNSQVILDCPGAERLLGKGDMLYKDSSLPEPIRMQGVFVSDEEINRVINFWKRQNLGVSEIDPISKPDAAQAANIGLRHGQAPAAGDAEPLSQSSFWDIAHPEDTEDGVKAQQDALYDKAVAAVRKRKSASISFLQRKFSIGYGRAARIVDMMEERGVVGPEKLGSSKPRDVLPE